MTTNEYCVHLVSPKKKKKYLNNYNTNKHFRSQVITVYINIYNNNYNNNNNNNNNNKELSNNSLQRQTQRDRESFKDYMQQAHSSRAYKKRRPLLYQLYSLPSQEHKP